MTRAAKATAVDPALAARVARDRDVLLRLLSFLFALTMLPLASTYVIFWLV